MAIQRVLEMDFTTDLGKTHTLRVYSAKDDLTGSEVSEAMDNIIAKNIFMGTGGELVSKLKAQVITTETSEITLV